MPQQVKDFFRAPLFLTAMIGIVLGGVSLLPSFLDSWDVFKGTVGVLGAGFILLAFCVHTRNTGGGRSHPQILLLTLSVGLFFVLSAFFSGNMVASFVGNALEQGTGVSILALLVIFYVSFVTFQTRESREPILWSILVIAGAASAVSLFDSFFFGMMQTPLPGSLRTLEMLSGSGWIAFLILRDASSSKAMLFIPIALTCFFSLLFFGTPEGVALTLLASVSILLVNVWGRGGMLASPRRAGALMVALVLATLWWAGLIPRVGGYAEFRLSEGFSSEISLLSLSESAKTFLFGAGPGNFSVVWNETRPKSFNTLLVWNETLESGYSSFLTRMTEWGIFPVLVLILLALLLPFIAWTHLRSFPGSFRNFIPSLLLFYYIAAWFFFSVPGITGEFLFAVVAGLITSVILEERSSLRTLSASRLRTWGVIAGGISGIFFLVTGSAALVASTFHERGIAVFAQGYTEEGEKLINTASSIFPSSLFARTLSELKQQSLDRSLDSSSLSPEAIATIAEDALQAASHAESLDPLSFDAQITLGNAHLRRAALGQMNGYQGAEDAYKKAMGLSPNHPLPLYLLAQLSLLKRDTEGARDFAIAALVLKPDYSEARSIIELLP